MVLDSSTHLHGSEQQYTLAGMQKGCEATLKPTQGLQIPSEGGAGAAVDCGIGVIEPVAAHTPGAQIQKMGR